MFKKILISFLPLLATVTFAATGSASFDSASPLDWSRRLADSEMKRIGTGYEAGGSNPRARWDYSPAVFALGLVRLAETTNNDSYYQFALRAVGSHVNADGTIKGYKLDD